MTYRWNATKHYWELQTLSESWLESGRLKGLDFSQGQRVLASMHHEVKIAEATK